ncbi:YybH family protein [Haliea sp. E17]|uniref:YybH family protein n=1 Tax=Haliea sp. E17 TaxID=3401576 RepID=UPI003AAD34DF
MTLVFILTGAGQAMADSAADSAALRAVDESWMSAYNSGDADALANLYAEDAVLMPPGVAPVQGRAAIRAYYAKDTAASMSAGMSMHLDAEPTGGVSGDLGWQSGYYRATDSSGAVVDTGKYLSVSVKKDGKWLYIRDTWNSDSP